MSFCIANGNTDSGKCTRILILFNDDGKMVINVDHTEICREGVVGSWSF